MLIKLVIWLLKWKRLSVRDRTVLTNVLLESIKAVPLKSIISIDQSHNIYVMGQPLDGDQVVKLRNSASSTIHSEARRLVQNQVRFAAIDKGFLKNYDDKDELFYKAALWYSQQENELLEALSGEITPVD